MQTFYTQLQLALVQINLCLQHNYMRFCAAGSRPQKSDRLVVFHARLVPQQPCSAGRTRTNRRRGRNCHCKGEADDERPRMACPSAVAVRCRGPDYWRWAACKATMKRRYGVSRHLLAGYLDEYMWRARHPRPNTLNDILDVIRHRYPV